MITLQLYSSAVAIRSDLDGSQLIAKGAALQAKLLSELADEDKPAFPSSSTEEVTSAIVTSKPIGLVFPSSSEETIPVVLVPAETPLPARRTIRIPTASGASRVAFEVWEGEVTLRELPLPPKEADSDEEDEEPEEPEKEAIVKKVAKLGGLALDVSAPKEKGAKATIEVRADVAIDGSLVVSTRQAESGAEWVSFSVKA